MDLYNKVTSKSKDNQAVAALKNNYASGNTNSTPGFNYNNVVSSSNLNPAAANNRVNEINRNINERNQLNEYVLQLPIEKQLNYWQSSDYRMSKAEKEKAKQYAKEKLDTINTGIRNGTFTQSEIAKMQLDPNSELNKSQVLLNKTSAITSFQLGALDSIDNIPKWAADKLNDDSAVGNAWEEQSQALGNSQTQAQTQSPVSYGAGQFTMELAKQGAMRGIVSDAIKDVSVLNNSFGKLGTAVNNKLANGGTAAQTMGRFLTPDKVADIALDNTLDLATDTLPSMVSDIASQKAENGSVNWGQVAKNTAGNIGLNAGMNALIDLPSFVKSVSNRTAGKTAADAVENAAINFQTPGQMLGVEPKKTASNIVRSENTIDKYIENASLGGKNNSEYAMYAKIDNVEAKELSQILGVDVSGMEHSLRDNDIRHILSNPANTIDDIKNIPDIVQNADFKFKGKDTGIYTDNDKLSKNPTVYYVKRHNGMTYYLEQVIEEDGVLSIKQLKKIPTGSVPKWIDKLPVDEIEKNKIKQKIIELSTSHHADVPTNVVPREHVLNEPVSNAANSIINPNIPQEQNGVNIDYAQSAVKNTQSSIDAKTFTGEAVWKNKDVDQPITVTGYAGNLNGIDYVNVQGSNSAIPVNEISTATDSRLGDFSVGAAKHNANSYSAMQNEYGTIPDGEKPFRQVDVPISTNGTDKVNKFARTAMEARATTEELIPKLEEYVAEGMFSHEVLTDKIALSNSIKDIEDYGFNHELTEWNKAIESGRQITKNDMVKAQLLYVAAGNAGDAETAMKLATDIAMQGVNAGQTAQSIRLLKKMTPEGKLYYAQKTVDTLQKEMNVKYGVGNVNIKIDTGVAEQLLKATDESDIRKATQALYKNIAEQLPVKFSDRVDAWRYLAMLGNTRTQIRNIAANTLSMPMRFLKKEIQGTLEASVNQARQIAGLTPFNRTTTVLPASKAQKDFAKADYAKMSDFIQDGGKYIDGKSAIQQAQNPFKINGDWGTKADSNILAKGARKAAETTSNVVSGVNKLSNWGLEMGDVLFSKHSYTDALSKYMKANNLNAEDMVGETLAKARQHAIRISQESVFREANWLATEMNKIENKNQLTKVLMGGTVPFKKTPLNIAKQGVQYSPAGLVKGIYDSLFSVKSGKKTATQAIESLSKGLSGTAAMGIGYILAKNGLISASGTDNRKEKSWETQIGSQNYSLNIGNYTYTIDWAGLGALPLFMGAEVAKLGEEKGWSPNAVITALSRVSEPLFETTMLQGLNNAIQSAAWGSEAQLTNMAMQSTQNFAGQFVPTALGQIARSVDDTRRSTYTDKTGVEGVLDRAVQQQKNKIPYLSKNSMPYLDVWGYEVKNTGGGFAGRLAYNMLSPGYLTKKTDDPVEQRIQDAYEKLKDTSILPSNNTTKISQDGNAVRLNASQYESFKRNKGEAMYNAIGQIQVDKFNKLDNERAAKVYKYIYDYAGQKAKYKLNGTEPDGWVIAADEYAKASGVDIGTAIAGLAVVRAAISKAEGKKDINGNTISGSKKAAQIKAIMQLGYNENQAYMLWEMAV